MFKDANASVRRAFGAASILAVVAALFVAFESAISKPDMTEFDPQEMGRWESVMWRSYYEGRWVQLACQTMQGPAGSMGFRGRTDRARLCTRRERHYFSAKNPMTRGACRSWSNTTRSFRMRRTENLIGGEPRWHESQPVPLRRHRCRQRSRPLGRVDRFRLRNQGEGQLAIFLHGSNTRTPS